MTSVSEGRASTSTSNSTAAKFSGVVTRWSLYLLFFLIPITFLPWTTEILEINKQTVLIILAAVAFGSWLGRMVMTRRLAFRGGWFNLIPLLFLGSVLVSSVMSLAGYQTWIGQGAQEYTSFLTTVSLVMLFYVLMDSAGEEKVQRGVISALVLSATIAGLVALCSVFGISLFTSMTKGFNTIGTINSLTAFLIIVTLLGVGLWTAGAGRRSFLPEGWFGVVIKICSIAVAVMAIFFLLAIDFWVLWVLLMVGSIGLLVFRFLRSDVFHRPKLLLIPAIAILLSVVFLFVKTPLQIGLPLVVSPGYQASYDISRQALGIGKGQLLFGTGPSTFVLDYQRFKPANVNATIFWNTGFDRAKSHSLTMLATLGVVGLALWLVFVLFLGARSLMNLVRERNQDEWGMSYALFAAWLAMLFLVLFYSMNMTLWFLFWGLSGLLAAQSFSKIRAIDVRSAPRGALLVSFGFLVVVIGILVGVFVTVQRYSAELTFAQAVRMDKNGATPTEIAMQVKKATERNSLNDVYFRNLSSALLFQARDILSTANGEPSEEQSQQVVKLVTESVAAARQASELSPNNVTNWSVRGLIYRDLMSFTQNAEDFAAATFERAIGLEPVNPVHWTNLGRVHLAVATRARTLRSSESEELAKQATEAESTALANAEVAFTNAINLKPDYAPAHYYLAITYDREGKLEDAARRLLDLRNADPNNLGISFELALTLLRLDQLEPAISEFERIIEISPDYSNAMWFLASAYELSGEQDKAITLVEHVSRLNPDNKLVQNRYSRMKAGEITTRRPGIPVPVEAGEETATTTNEQPIVEGGVPAEVPAENTPTESDAVPQF